MKQFTITYLHNGETKSDIILTCENARAAWIAGRNRVNELPGKSVIKDCKLNRPAAPAPEPIAFIEPSKLQRLPFQGSCCPDFDTEATGLDPVTELLEQANRVLEEDAELNGTRDLHRLAYPVTAPDPEDEETEDEEDDSEDRPAELRFSI